MVNGIQIGLVNDHPRFAYNGDFSDVPVYDKIKGLQLAWSNTTGIIKGIQAGLINNCVTTKGIQTALSNFADNLFGVQIGLVNSVAGYLKGLQIGGINANTGTTRGLQLGLFNETGAKYGGTWYWGVQVGVVGNIVEGTLNGLQIGALCRADQKGNYVQIGVFTFREGDGPWYTRASPFFGYHKDKELHQKL